MFDVEAFVKEEWPKHIPLRTGEKAKRPGDGEMAVMYYGGDFKLIWDPENTDETDAAKDAFKRLKGKGFTAFKVTDAKGEKGEQLRGDFDPNAGRLIMAPAIRGGF